MLLKNSVIYLGAKIISSISGLIVISLLTKNLTKVEFGILGLIWVIQPFLFRVMNLGVDSAYSIKYYKFNKKEKISYLYNSILIIIIGFVLVGGISLVFFNKINIWIFNNFVSLKLFTLILLGLFSILFSSYLQTLLKYENRPYFFFFITIIQSLVMLVLIYIFFLNNFKDLYAYFLAFFVSNSIGMLVFFIHILKNYNIRFFEINVSFMKELLKVGIPFIPTVIASVILSAGDRFVIKYILGLEAVAIYTLGYRFAEYFNNFLFQPFMQAYTPYALKLASENLEKYKKENEKIVNYALIIGGLLLLFSSIFFKDILVLISNKSYEESYYIFGLATYGILIYSIANLISQIIFHYEKTKILMYFTFIAGIFNIILNILAVKVIGIIGAVIVTIITYFLLFILYWFYNKKYLKNKIKLFKILFYLGVIFIFLIGILYVQNIFYKILIFLGYVLFVSKDLIEVYMGVKNVKS